MTTWAVVPARGFARAKSRLTTLEPAARTAFARALLSRVLQSVSDCPAIERVAVATDCHDVATFARARGAEPVLDARSGTLRHVIDDVIDAVVAPDDTVVVIMADLPRITSRDVHELVAQLSTCELALAPDRDDAGTNALAMTAAGRIRTCFGHHDSFPRHRARADRLRIPLATMRNPRLAFDVDVPDDYAALGPRALNGLRRAAELRPPRPAARAGFAGSALRAWAPGQRPNHS